MLIFKLFLQLIILVSQLAFLIANQFLFLNSSFIYMYFFFRVYVVTCILTSIIM
jgi:hypothetical protein